MPLSFSNSLLLIAMKSGQRVAQDPRIHCPMILNPWTLLLNKWASGLAWLHGNIVMRPQMWHQVVLGRIRCITPIKKQKQKT
jgi:hypothetical protein